MTVVLHALGSIAIWLAVAPIVPGIINKVKAWIAGRTGPPVLQLYYDLARLWRKGTVLSTSASPGHVAGPAVALIALGAATLLLPLGRAGSPLAFEGDALLFVYLMGLARFAMAAAAMDTGSAFEGMGARVLPLARQEPSEGRRSGDHEDEDQQHQLLADRPGSLRERHAGVRGRAARRAPLCAVTPDGYRRHG